MAKKIKISESQYKQMLYEGVVIQGETDSTGKADISKTDQTLSSSGINKKNVSVQFSGNAMSGGNGTSTTTTTTMEEQRLITKKELQSNRLRYLKENSEVLSLNNFMKRLH